MGAWATLGGLDPVAWPAVGEALGGHAAALGQLVLALLAAYGAGGPVIRLLDAPAAGIGRVAWRGLAGFGVIAAVQHGLGDAGLLFRGLLGIEIAGWVAGGARAAWRARTSWRVALPRDARLPAALAAAGLVAAFAVARLPDTHEDPRLYHLAAPESYLLEHKIHLMLRNFNWHMPRGNEMVWLPAWALGGIGAAKQATVATTVVAALMVGLLAAAAAPGPAAAAAGWWAAAVFLGGGQVLNQCWQPKTDMALVLDLTAAVWAAAAWAGGAGRWGAACALAAGQAAGVKYQAAFVLAALGLVGLRRARGSIRPRRLALLGVVAAAGCAGWGAESWAFLGNPVHPFASGFFHDLFFRPEYLAVLHRVQVQISPPEARSALDLYGAVWRVAGDPANATPALFALVPLALFAVAGPSARFVRAVLLLAWVLWLLTERVARYMLPGLALLAALGGAAFAAWEAGGRLRGRALAALIALPLAANLGARLGPRGWAVLAGRLDPGRFFHETYTTWDDVRRFLNAAVRPGERVLLGGEMRRLWLTCRVDSDGGNFASFPWAATRESRTVSEARKKFRQAGYAYVAYNFVSAEYRFMNWTPGPAWDDRQARLYADLVRTSFRPAFVPARYDNVNGGFWVWALARRPAGPYRVDYLPFTEGQFEEAYGLYRARRFAESLAVARRVRDRMPPCGMADLVLGTILAANERWAETHAVLAQLDATGFVGDGSWSYQGTAALKLGLFQEGLHDYARLWRLKPDAWYRGAFAYGFYQIGKPRLVRRDFAGAARWLEQAVFMSPGEPAPRYDLARAYHGLGRDGDARREAEAAHALAPEDRTIATYAAILAGRSGLGTP